MNKVAFVFTPNRTAPIDRGLLEMPPVYGNTLIYRFECQPSMGVDEDKFWSYVTGERRLSLPVCDEILAERVAGGGTPIHYEHPEADVVDVCHMQEQSRSGESQINQLAFVKELTIINLFKRSPKSLELNMNQTNWKQENKTMTDLAVRRHAESRWGSRFCQLRCFMDNNLDGISSYSLQPNDLFRLNPQCLRCLERDYSDQNTTISYSMQQLLSTRKASTTPLPSLVDLLIVPVLFVVFFYIDVYYYTMNESFRRFWRMKVSRQTVRYALLALSLVVRELIMATSSELDKDANCFGELYFYAIQMVLLVTISFSRYIYGRGFRLALFAAIFVPRIRKIHLETDYHQLVDSPRCVTPLDNYTIATLMVVIVIIALLKSRQLVLCDIRVLCRQKHPIAGNISPLLMSSVPLLLSLSSIYYIYNSPYARLKLYTDRRDSSRIYSFLLIGMINSLQDRKDIKLSEILSLSTEHTRTYAKHCRLLFELPCKCDLCRFLNLRLAMKCIQEEDEESDNNPTYTPAF